MFFLAPSLGHTAEENQKALEDVLARFKTQKVDAETLARVKTQARAGVIRRLANNSSLAGLLVTCYAGYGDWRRIFTALDELNKVTADDVLRVAQKTFVATNRTVAYTAPGGRP